MGSVWLIYGTVLLLHSVDGGIYFDRAVVVEPGQEMGGVPVGVRCFPVPVRPDQSRSVPTK